MRRSYRRVITSLFAFLLLVVQPAYAESPDRYVDGAAFANYMTRWVLRNTDPKVRGKDSIVHWLNTNLYGGGAFSQQVTPERKKLKEWMLSRPDASISPDQLYAKAISLQGGDVQKGLILVWDVLRDGWSSEQDRNLYPHIRKLIDITGELDLFDGIEHVPPAGYPHARLARQRLLGRRSDFDGIKAIRGDNFSAWYHFSGTALHSYVKTNSRFNLLPGKAQTKFLIWMEEVALFNEFVDPLKRRAIDDAGAEFGARLARNIRRYRTAEEFERAAGAKNTKYIYDNEEFYGEKWRLKPGQHPRDFGTDLSTKSAPPLLARADELRRVIKNGNASVEDLARFLDDPNRVLREEAAAALARHEDSASVLALFKKRVEMKHDPERRRELFNILEGRNGPEVLDVLRQVILNGPDEAKRAAAVALLREFPPSDQTLALLRRAVQDPSSSVRASAINALAKIKSDEAVALILEAAGGVEKLAARDAKEWLLRVGAIHALSGRSDPLSLQALEKVISSLPPNTPRINTAGNLLLTFSMVGTLPGSMRMDRDSDVQSLRDTAAKALRGRSDPASVALLERLLKDRNKSVRQVAAEELESRRALGTAPEIPPRSTSGCLSRLLQKMHR